MQSEQHTIPGSLHADVHAWILAVLATADRESMKQGEQLLQRMEAEGWGK